MDEKAVNARVITSGAGEPMLQMRIDCGILQMHLAGRPDGTRPHGFATYLEYLDRRLETLREPDDNNEDSGKSRRLWLELDREMTQYYHRRLALLAVASQTQDSGQPYAAKEAYERAAGDANHTLRAMDFIVDNCDDEDNVDSHEHFRPFVLWHRTIAMTQQRIIETDFDEAVEQIKCGMTEIVNVYKEHGMTKWLKHDPSIAELKSLEKQIRRRYNIKVTLKEQLEQALTVENYEKAAKIRDQLKAKGNFLPPDRPVVRGAARY